MNEVLSREVTDEGVRTSERSTTVIEDTKILRVFEKDDRIIIRRDRAGDNFNLLASAIGLTREDAEYVVGRLSELLARPRIVGDVTVDGKIWTRVSGLTALDPELPT